MLVFLGPLMTRFLFAFSHLMINAGVLRSVGRIWSVQGVEACGSMNARSAGDSVFVPFGGISSSSPAVSSVRRQPRTGIETFSPGRKQLVVYTPAGRIG